MAWSRVDGTSSVVLLDDAVSVWVSATLGCCVASGFPASEVLQSAVWFWDAILKFCQRLVRLPGWLRKVERRLVHFVFLRLRVYLWLYMLRLEELEVLGRVYVSPETTS